MSHESVWYSRPRTYGKGSREWYVHPEDLEAPSRRERDQRAFGEKDGQGKNMN